MSQSTVLCVCRGQRSPIKGGQQPLWNLMLGIKFLIGTNYLLEFGQQLLEPGP